MLKKSTLAFFNSRVAAHVRAALFVKAPITIVLLTLAALSIPTYAEQPYRCECCAAYFGKNPDAPTYWNRGLGLGRLMRDHKYEEVLSRFDDQFRKNDYTLSDVAWVGDALYALGSIKSGLRDPLEPLMVFEDHKPGHPVADDLRWMHDKYGGRIWDRAAIERYGGAAVCAADEVRKGHPDIARLFNRRVSVLIVTGRVDQVLNEVATLKKDSLVYVYDLGEYLARITQEYVGRSLYEEGAAYLATVKRVHGISKETREYWVQRLVRGVEQGDMPAGRKRALLAKIRAI